MVFQTEAAMEIFVKDVDGISDNSIVSVRCGATRRQAPLATMRKQPLKFRADQAACCEPLKIDVLQHVASAWVVLNPNESQYRVGLDSENSKQLAMNLDIRGIAGSPSDNECPSATTNARPTSAGGNSRFQEAAGSAREYLEAHGLLQYVQSLLHAVIKARPKDPHEFMVKQMAATAFKHETVDTCASDTHPALRDPTAPLTQTLQPSSCAVDSLAAAPSPTGPSRHEQVQPQPHAPLQTKGVDAHDDFRAKMGQVLEEAAESGDLESTSCRLTPEDIKNASFEELRSYYAMQVLGSATPNLDADKSSSDSRGASDQDPSQKAPLPARQLVRDATEAPGAALERAHENT